MREKPAHGSAHDSTERHRDQDSFGVVLDGVPVLCSVDRSRERQTSVFQQL
jgi:hypothetical protein